MGFCIGGAWAGAHAHESLPFEFHHFSVRMMSEALYESSTIGTDQHSLTCLPVLFMVYAIDDFSLSRLQERPGSFQHCNTYFPFYILYFPYRHIYPIYGGHYLTVHNCCNFVYRKKSSIA